MNCWRGGGTVFMGRAIASITPSVHVLEVDVQLCLPLFANNSELVERVLPRAKMLSRSLGGVLLQNSRSAAQPFLLPKIVKRANCLHTTNKMSKFALASKYQGLEKNVW